MLDLIRYSVQHVCEALRIAVNNDVVTIRFPLTFCGNDSAWGKIPANILRERRTWGKIPDTFCGNCVLNE